MPTTSITVRFDLELATDLNDLARNKGAPKSMIVREAVAFYLKTMRGRSEEQLRKVMSSEYTALAIDLIVSTEYPADRDKLLFEAGRRAEAVDATA